MAFLFAVIVTNKKKFRLNKKVILNEKYKYWYSGVCWNYCP